jgi:uncharacterized protein YndB with AHSA1/START domain
MLHRSTTFPVRPERLWEELTDPEALADWFGYRVEWELTRGGRATFTDGEQGARSGRIDEVTPGRHLRFSWWPDGDETAASRVDYELEPEEGGTRLTVTEIPVPAEASGTAAPVVDLAGPRPAPEGAAPEHRAPLVRPGSAGWRRATGDGAPAPARALAA